MISYAGKNVTLTASGAVTGILRYVRKLPNGADLYSIPIDFPKDIFLSELLNRHALGDEQPYQAVMSLVLEALPRSVQVGEIDLRVAKI